MSVGSAVLSILVFPGFLFLVALGLAGEFVDRKLYARLQNRQGPPWFQPVADMLKLFGKEDVVPEEADRHVFTLAPVLALAATITTILYIPIWQTQAAFAFSGDLIVVLYLLLIPTVTFFLGGWTSSSVFATLGAVRAITQVFAYEIPLFVSLLAPALLANTWSISEMAAFYAAHPWLWSVNLIGLGVALVALLGKLERVPFDIPEAETEIVAGSFTEYCGRRLAFFRLTVDCEAIVGVSLVAAVFLPFGLGLGLWLGLLVYVAKVLGLLAVLALMRTLFARLRIDQMISFCWKLLAPIAFLQVLINLVVRELI